MARITQLFMDRDANQKAYERIVTDAAIEAAQTGDVSKLQEALQTEGRRPSPSAATEALGWAMGWATEGKFAKFPLDGMKLLHKVGASLDGKTGKLGTLIRLGILPPPINCRDPFRLALRLDRMGKSDFLDYILEQRAVSATSIDSAIYDISLGVGTCSSEAFNKMQRYKSSLNRSSVPIVTS